jgi:hypothetical protein
VKTERLTASAEVLKMLSPYGQFRAGEVAFVTLGKLQTNFLIRANYLYFHPGGALFMGYPVVFSDEPDLFRLHFGSGC